MPVLSTIAITTGEPAGIGPEIALRAAWALRGKVRSILIGDFRLLSDLAMRIDLGIRLQAIDMDALRGGRVLDAAILHVVDCPLVRVARPGQPDASNSRAVLRMLDIAVEGTQGRVFDAMVTAPLQKSIINDAGVPFTGHTEYLAEKTQTAQVVMMLAGSVAIKESSFPLRVALATTHLPLKDVASAITTEDLLETLTIIDRDLKKWFGIASPRILVCGLNPHAGESGYLGREEIEVIAPVIAVARKQNIDATGPYPADTVFQPSLLQQADCVLAMYHDQGLPVLKHASFGSAVNVTLGLPMIRTSVDHGTALDQAEKGIGHANYRSMIEAILLAAQMAAQGMK
ncbi:MAG: 4-hydroxythreonine-4-phosphate dehydrogenase PdxA [Oxalobacter sp.]|nr:MAG: 4-hydroxythreonine-4-phosphate dehydrogenase PdxA [Oxalobacter sp.]